MDLSEQQRSLYAAVVKSRDEVAYAFHEFHRCTQPMNSTLSRDLANARIHFTESLNALIESVKNGKQSELF